MAAQDGSRAPKGNTTESRLFEIMEAMTVNLSKEKAEMESCLDRLEEIMKSIAGRAFRSGQGWECDGSTRATVVAARG